jgi:hypothetical protein
VALACKGVGLHGLLSFFLSFFLSFSTRSPSPQQLEDACASLLSAAFPGYAYAVPPEVIIVIVSSL